MRGNMKNMMKQMQQMQKEMEKSQGELEATEFTGVANDDLVPRRHKTMTVNMRAFIEKIKSDKNRIRFIPYRFDSVSHCSFRRAS